MNHLENKLKKHTQYEPQYFVIRFDRHKIAFPWISQNKHNIGIKESVTKTTHSSLKVYVWVIKISVLVTLQTKKKEIGCKPHFEESFVLGISIYTDKDIKHVL